jgi:hypothetical protein
MRLNSLTPPTARSAVMARAVTYRGFARDDGLWDIEAHVLDTREHSEQRHEGPELKAGEPAHDMVVRVTFDAVLTVVNVETVMRATPFDDCQSAVLPMTGLIGATMGRGWRKAVDNAIGGVGGCTHLRELLYNLATPAIHTYTLHSRRHGTESFAASANAKVVPAFVGKCISWRIDGPVVSRTYPQFFMRSAHSETDTGRS